MRWNFQIDIAKWFHIVFLGIERTGDILDKIVHEFMGAFDPIFCPILPTKIDPRMTQ